jgi:homeobox protein cut-like
MASSNFAAALETWRTINLAELQKKLDVQGIEIVDNQKEGLLGRKALADKTKGASPVRNISALAQYAAEFKKLPDTDKLNAFKGLLKGVCQSLGSTHCTDITSSVPNRD